MNKVDSFKIRIYCFDNNQKNIFDFNNGKTIKDFHPRTSNINLHPEVLMADPFLFVQNNTLYLFYEKQTYWNPATIEMTCTKDLQIWTKPQIVLQEDFHLSYPYVFKYNETVYMIPETHKVKEIRLYKANNDLTQFTYYKTLINEDKSFVDSSLYISSDKVFLFTTSIESDIQLHLYISDNIYGPYAEHIKSPVANGSQYGRNGGGIVNVNNELYRINQNCLASYGENLNIFSINDISPTSYKESLYVENILPINDAFYKDGGHHFSVAQFEGKTIVATDAKDCRYFLMAQLNTNLRNKIKALFRLNSHC